jgi:hypothetical protein
MDSNIKPLELIGGEDGWIKVRVNLSKLNVLDKLENQIRIYITRRVGMDNLRNLKIGYEGNDVIENKFTLAIRYSKPD